MTAMQKYAALYMPQTVHYGRTAFEIVGRETAARGSKAIIVSDKVMDRLGYVAQCQANLMKRVLKALYIQELPLNQQISMLMRH